MRATADDSITPWAEHGVCDMGAAILNAHQGVAVAQEHRARIFRAAADAGLTRREIAEAAGLSASGVQKIIGKDKRTTLDSPVTPSPEDTP